MRGPNKQIEIEIENLLQSCQLLTVEYNNTFYNTHALTIQATTAFQLFRLQTKPFEPKLPLPEFFESVLMKTAISQLQPIVNQVSDHLLPCPKDCPKFKGNLTDSTI